MSWNKKNGIPQPTPIDASIKSSDGNEWAINESGQAHVVLRGEVCATCSTETPLAGDAEFTGAWIDVLDYATIHVVVKSDVASATDGLIVEKSKDGSTVIDNDVYTIPANTGKTFCPTLDTQYLRVRYINGSNPQTSFQLSTLLKKGASLPSSHRIQDSIIDDDDAQLTKAVLSGKNPSGDYVNFQSTAAGNFKVSLEELENDVSVNSNQQLKVTQYDSSGNEGQKIIGVDYLAGNSGVDSATETLQTIHYEHHEIHAGSHYYIAGFVNLDTSDNQDFVITTPNTTKWLHMTWLIQGNSETQFYVYEGATITGGTTATPINNNRNSSNTSDATIVANPTVNTTGTLIYSATGGKSGTTPARADLQALQDRDREIILKQNTIYLFRITSADDDNNVSYIGEWYEHTNKN